DRPSGITALSRCERSTTWLLVRISPSGVKQTPEPPPWPTSILTTAGPTVSTARMTASEYASRRWESSFVRRWMLTYSSYESRLDGTPPKQVMLACGGWGRGLAGVFPSGAADDASRLLSGVLAVFQHLNAVDEHVPHPGRVLVRLLIRGVNSHRLR